MYSNQRKHYLYKILRGFFFTILKISPFPDSEAVCEIGTAFVKVVIYIEVRKIFLYMLKAEILPFIYMSN